MKITSPYMTTAEAALYVRCVHPDGTPNIDALRKWLARWRVPTLRRGHNVLVAKAVLDQFLTERTR